MLFQLKFTPTDGLGHMYSDKICVLKLIFFTFSVSFSEIISKNDGVSNFLDPC